MTETRREDALTTRQLLDALRERIASILQNKPTDLTIDVARAYEEGIGDMLIHARSLVNSFHITLRTPPEVLGMISSYLGEDDLFSASQVCQHWRSILTSFASQWTRISCYNTPRAIACLERCGSMPIQLLLEPPFANRALENVLLRGNEITWLTVDHHPDHLSQLQQLFTSSRPTVERLHVYSDYFRGWTTEAQKVREIWQHFPLLRELFVSRHFVPINQFTAPNLVHLALEHTGNILNVTVKSLLDMLSGCPLLETLLLDYSDILPPGTIRGHPSIRFPRLRTIEVGGYEVHSRLITYLDFPPNVAVGFRMMRTSDVCGTIPHAVLSSIQHVFTRIDVRSITLAAATHYKGHILIRVRFEGPHGSLEITVGDIQDHTQPQRLLFGPEGVLFSHSSHIENVTELQVVGCFFHTDGGFDRVNAAMPNVDTISFSQCDGPHVFGLLTSGNPSSPPFPRLERVMVLGSESRLEEMARRRRDLGVPLKTLAIGRGHGDFEYEPLEDYTALGGLVGDLRTGCPVEMWWWDTENEILRRWSAISASVMLLVHESRFLFRLYRFDTAREDAGFIGGDS